jgi:hypothetical protein
MPDEDNIKHMPINELHQEEGAHELASSPNMEPYLDFAIALMKGADPTPQLDELRQVPLEERYVWRVASALKYGNRYRRAVHASSARPAEMST